MSLPSGYSQLTYIQSSGTQYIDTGFCPTNSTRIVIDAQINTYSNTVCAFFGTRRANSQSADDSFLVYQTGANTLRSDYYGSNQTLTLGTTTNSRLTIDKNQNVTTVGSVSVTNTMVTQKTSYYPLFLFACNTTGSATQKSTMKLYSCKIYDNDTLVRDFIPCSNATETVGLWDDVNSTFYSNVGDGSFTGLAEGSGSMLGDMAVGSIVKLNVDGAAKEFLVVHQGKPSSLYDDSCSGTWLLMKDCYEERQWHSSNQNSYKHSTIHSYLNSTFLDLFDVDIQDQIKTVKIPYVNGTGSSAVASGANGLSTKIFLLSGYEAGLTTDDDSSFPVDGAKLSYFESGTSNSAEEKRSAYFNGGNTIWFFRSPYTQGSDQVCASIPFLFSYHCTDSYGIRPALVLPTNLLISSDDTITTDPAAPKGTHNTLLEDGTVYTIEVGQELSASGTVYEIESGKVMADDGTVYEIPFVGGKCTVVLTGSGDSSCCYVNINGAKYYQISNEAIVDVAKGSEIECVVKLSGYGALSIYLNGEVVEKAQYSNQQKTYTYTVTNNVRIELEYSYFEGGSIRITDA